MDKLLTILLFSLAVGVMFFAFPDGFLAIFFNSFLAAAAFALINYYYKGEEKDFVRRIFVVALILRVSLATVTYIFDLQGFFGGDSQTYDLAGYGLYNTWFGYPQTVGAEYLNFTTRATSGWGMTYVVAGIYALIGRNAFAIQLFNSVLGAATSCLIYGCAQRIFSNKSVAKASALLVAVFPSLVVWSSQGLKDAIICFLIVLAINSVFSLQEKFSYQNLAVLLFAVMGIYALRFYIFFAFTVAVVGSFFIGSEKNALSVIRQMAILILLMLGLTYFGVIDNAQNNLATYGNLEMLQRARLDQTREAESSFGEDIDVSTSGGAIQALPIGLTYILLAPFPWQVKNFRQAITLPEVFVWWTMIPFMIAGIWYSLRNRFRQSIAVILFTLLLTVSYAIFQGNVGTAYRMRAQMQIFYFIFVAAGFVILQEKRENKQLILKAQRLRMLQNRDPRKTV